MNDVKIRKSRVLTVPELSEYLRVHPSTVYRMLKKKQPPAFRVGSDWRFTAGSIEQWLAELQLGGRAVAGSTKAGTSG